MDEIMDMGRILDELLQITSNCLWQIEKKEELGEENVKKAIKELEKASKKMNMISDKVYKIEDQSEHEISNDVVLKYIGSRIYDNLIDLDSRNGNKIDT